MLTTPYCMVYCTFPDAPFAEKIARRLTEERLIACASIIPHLTSIYSWEGKVVEGKEVLMLLKTRQDKLPDLEKAIMAQHPYKVAEFIAVPLVYGHQPYLDWVEECVNNVS